MTANAPLLSVGAASPAFSAAAVAPMKNAGELVAGLSLLRSTTIAGFEAALLGLDDYQKFGEFAVCTLQEYHKKL